MFAPTHAGRVGLCQHPPQAPTACTRLPPPAPTCCPSAPPPPQAPSLKPSPVVKAMPPPPRLPRQCRQLIPAALLPFRALWPRWVLMPRSRACPLCIHSARAGQLLPAAAAAPASQRLPPPRLHISTHLSLPAPRPTPHPAPSFPPTPRRLSPARSPPAPPLPLPPSWWVLAAASPSHLLHPTALLFTLHPPTFPTGRLLPLTALPAPLPAARRRADDRQYPERRHPVSHRPCVQPGGVLAGSGSLLCWVCVKGWRRPAALSLPHSPAAPAAAAAAAAACTARHLGAPGR